MKAIEALSSPTSGLRESAVPARLTARHTIHIESLPKSSQRQEELHIRGMLQQIVSIEDAERTA